MIKKIVYFVFMVIGGVIGYQFSPYFFNLIDALFNTGEIEYAQSVGALIGVIVFALILATRFIDYIIKVIKLFEEYIKRTPITEIFIGVVGMLLGLLTANLIRPAVAGLPWVGGVLPVILFVFLGYIGFKIATFKREEISGILSLQNIKEILPTISNKRNNFKTPQACKSKILDTSVIIDGRIADICRTGFVDGRLIIPSFVLQELQHIADSSDTLKRNKGRRGLDILKVIQNEQAIQVDFWEGDFEEVNEVDAKIVKLAKMLDSQIITTDYNLNKVSELQGVSVLNINDLGNAVKPMLLPGEEVEVAIIKEGKEHNQGVAYLPDGTMIVVEGGNRYIGEKIDAVVTSVLQTSAGRMIFARPEENQTKRKK